MKLPYLLRKTIGFLKEKQELNKIRRSGLFDEHWYLENNPDVVQAKVEPGLHYLHFGGMEGRDPNPDFSSKFYLETYEDVKKAGMNPLIHYLRYGRKEGRLTQLPKSDIPNSLFKCPVCRESVNQFLPLPVFYLENMKKYGYPYTTDDAETMNAEQYSCPHCGASDRDRLYACYMDKIFPQYHSRGQLHLLDIAPSPPLNKFINAFEKIVHHTADLLVDGVDLVVDITNMPEIDSDSFDILICSHVLEHVKDDRKALSELYRVLKPDGWGILMVPIILTIDQIDEDPEVMDIAERWRRFAQDDHVRLYSKFGFIERIEAAGFTLKQLGVDYFGESVFRQYGITNKSVLYIAQKTNLDNE